MTALSFNLAFAATIATAADMFAWLLLVLPGRVHEGNPIVHSMVAEGAAGARLLLLVVLWSLAIASDRIGGRAVYPVRLMLTAAIVVGVLGAASTIASAAA